MKLEGGSLSHEVPTYTHFKSLPYTRLIGSQILGPALVEKTYPNVGKLLQLHLEKEPIKFHLVTTGSAGLFMEASLCELDLFFYQRRGQTFTVDCKVDLGP